MTTTKAPAPDVDHLVENIRTAYAASSAEQRADGVAWYDVAHALATELDPADPLRAAGVISALSPRTEWGQNKRLAVRCYTDGGIVGGTGHGLPVVPATKANAIYHGADVMATLKAPKTQAFAACIANPSDPHAVVIDRHALSVAYGRQVTDDEVAALNLKGRYALFADAYRKAAADLGLTPAQVQAVTWVYWRETHIRVAASVRRAAGRTEPVPVESMSTLPITVAVMVA